MKYPYYAFSAEFGSFKLEAEYAKELGLYLFYDEKGDFFFDKEGNEVDVTGMDIFPRTGVLQAKKLVDAIYNHGAFSTFVKQDDYEKILDWPDYIRTKRTNIIMSGREILDNPEKIIELFGTNQVFFKTKNKNYSQIIDVERLINKEGNFYQALDAHQDDDFILSDVVDIKEDEFGMREFRCFVINGGPSTISRVHDYLVDFVDPALEYKVRDILKELKDTDFPKSFVIDLFEYVDDDGEICLDVLECNPLVASGTYLYNSVFRATNGYLNHCPRNGGFDPFKTIPTEKMKYGPVEMYSRESKVKGSASICYELPGGFAADLMTFALFGTASDGMFLHFEHSHNLDPTNIGSVASMGIVNGDDELANTILEGDESEEDKEVIQQLIKRLQGDKKVKTAD